MLFDYTATRMFIEDAVSHYDKSAPALVGWLDEMYRDLADQPHKVSAWELLQLQQLRMDGEWEQPNYAQNRWYKVRAALGKDCGVLSF